MSFPRLGSVFSISLEILLDPHFSQIGFVWNDFQPLQLIHKVQSYRKKTDIASVSHASYNTQCPVYELSLTMYNLLSSLIRNVATKRHLSLLRHNVTCKVSIAVVSYFLLQLVWSVHFRLFFIYLSPIKIRRFQSHHR